MKPWILVAVLIGVALTAFVAGFVSSHVVMGGGRIWLESASVRCVSERACVGDSTDEFLRTSYLEDEIGGLSGILCSRDRIFLSDIVRGETCSASRYALEFRNPMARTLVFIEDGSVSEIQRGPLHVLDF